MVHIEHENTKEVDTGIRKTIPDGNLYRQVKDLKDQLEPVAKALNTAQSDNTKLADVVDLFYGLLENKELAHHKKAIEHRFKQYVDPCHLAAYLTHPKFKGEKLSVAEKEKAMKFFMEKDEAYVPILLAFEGEGAPFLLCHQLEA
jgi:hypothetical protein